MSKPVTRPRPVAFHWFVLAALTCGLCACGRPPEQARIAPPAHPAPITGAPPAVPPMGEACDAMAAALVAYRKCPAQTPAEREEATALDEQAQLLLPAAKASAMSAQSQTDLALACWKAHQAVRAGLKRCA